MRLHLLAGVCLMITSWSPALAGDAPSAAASERTVLATPAPPSPPKAALATRATPLRRLVVSVTLAPLLLGGLTASDRSGSGSLDAETGGVLTPSVDYRINEFVSLGSGIQIAVPVMVKPNGRFAGEVDIPLRLKVGAPIHEMVYPYLSVTPGLGIWLPEGRAGNEVGFSLGVAGGFAIGKETAFVIELGYRWLFLSIDNTSARFGYFAPQFGVQTSF